MVFFESARRLFTHRGVRRRQRDRQVGRRHPNLVIELEMQEKFISISDATVKLAETDIADETNEAERQFLTSQQKIN